MTVLIIFEEEGNIFKDGTRPTVIGLSRQIYPILFKNRFVFFCQDVEVIQIAASGLFCQFPDIAIQTMRKQKAKPATTNIFKFDLFDRFIAQKTQIKQ